MKYLKTMLVLTMAFASTQTFAQQNQEKEWNPEQKAQKQTERLTESLSLSEEQAAKVKEIQLDAIADMREAREKGEWTKESRREFMKKQRAEKETKIKEVLTPEQEQKWEELKEDSRGRNERKKRGHKGGKNLNPEERATKQAERMKKSLNLSTEQAAQVKEIFLAAAEARKEVTRDENSSQKDHKAVKTQERTQQEMALKKVLTEAQWTQWEQLKQDRKAKQQDGKGKGFRGEKSLDKQ